MDAVYKYGDHYFGLPKKGFQLVEDAVVVGVPTIAESSDVIRKMAGTTSKHSRL